SSPHHGRDAEQPSRCGACLAHKCRRPGRGKMGIAEFLTIPGIGFAWIVLCIIVAVAANTRGRSPIGGFICAILISPVLGGLLLLALPKREIQPAVGPIYTEDWLAERGRRRAIVAWTAGVLLVAAAASVVAWIILQD